jgi:hypothetical protein
MGFRKSPHIMYDQMSLSDESSEKNLLIQLADRDIISHETVLERFKEVPSVEKMRLKREDKDRNKENLPEKASPFHNPNKEFEMEKMDKQAQINEKVAEKKESQKPINPNGRPKNKIDEGPRQKRRETPKSKPGVAELISWANESFDKISEITTTAYLAVANKKNMRGLSKVQCAELEELKLHVLSNIEPMSEVTNQKIKEIIGSSKKMSQSFAKMLKTTNVDFKNSTTEKFRRHAISCYIECILDG